ncbi:MAG: AI-2E family transporter [Bdellovibrionota bacterium]
MNAAEAQIRLERWVRWGLILFTAVLAGWGLSHLEQIFIPFLVSIIIAYLLNPFVLALEARAVRRESAVILLTLVFGGLAAALLYFTVPVVVDEVTELKRIVPGRLEETRKTLVQMEKALAEKYTFLEGKNFADSLFEMVGERAGSVRMAAPEWIARHSTALVMTVLLPFFVFFLLRDGGKWLDGFFASLSHRSVETGISLVREFNAALGGYLRSLVVDAAVVGGMVAVGLLWIDLNYAVLIGIVTGIGNFIPYFGPVLGWGIASLAALLQGGPDTGWMLVKVLVVFGAVKTFDDWIFQPLIVGHGAHVHPVLVVLSVFVGGSVLGIIGMVVAVPVTVICQVSIRIAVERSRFAHEQPRGTPLPAERLIV